MTIVLKVGLNDEGMSCHQIGKDLGRLELDIDTQGDMWFLMNGKFLFKVNSYEIKQAIKAFNI